MTSHSSDELLSVAKGEIRLISPTPPGWPFTQNPTGSDANPPKIRPHIAILDSSFNPPTKAHLAMISSPFPRDSKSSPGSHVDGTDAHDPFTARLLLFSTTNVEKKPSPGDPTLEQRFGLITRLAEHLTRTEPLIPTAVGLINEPTFVGKSEILHRYLSAQPDGLPGEGSKRDPPRLTFMIGTDTLIRCFDPRFYGAVAGGMTASLDRFFKDEGSRLVCARRQGEEAIEAALVKRDEVKRYLEPGSIRFSGTGKENWAGMSSTAVRRAVKAGDWDKVETLVIPEIRDYIQQEQLYQQ